MTKEDAMARLQAYRRMIDKLHGKVVYVEDDEGLLRRWYPLRPLIDKKD